MSYRNVFYYDSRRNLTCVRDSDLGLTYYTYDAGSRMTSLKNPFGEVTYYEYRLDNQVSCRILGNGCLTYYEYDSIGRTSRVENRKGDGSMISSFDYERDAVGNPISIEREDGYTVYYEYDARHQLTRETHVDEGDTIYAWEWDYDAAGNREYQVFNGEATYYEYNAANELTTEAKGGQVTYYHYDRCGNTTAKQEPVGTTYYHWDYENLLTQIDLPDGAHNYFAYDADGKRVSKRDSEGFTEFIYQGPNMLALQLERNEAGETQVQYTMGAGLESMRRGEASSFYHYDWLGSTHELTDDEQAVTDTYLYNAWGEVLERTGNTENPHQWVGRARYYGVANIAMAMLGIRYYQIGAGRFLSVDPISVSLYQYCAGLPLSLIDPLGLAWQRASGPGRPPTAPGRVDPKKEWWGSEPLPWYIRLQIEIAGGVFAWLSRLYQYYPGPISQKMAFHWATNTGSPYSIDMERFMNVSSEERGRYRDDLYEAATFAEGIQGKGSAWETFIVTRWDDPREREMNAMVLKAESLDWWWAVGGHCSYAYARVQRRGNCFQMHYTWKLEDTFTGKDKIDAMFRVETGGIASGFLVNGEVTRTYTWSKGEFRNKYPDPWRNGIKE